MGGGADSASSLKIAFVMQIFPKNSHRGSLRHLHAWCKKNICKKVHICTKWKLQKLFYVPAPYSWWGGGGFCQVNQLFLMSPFFPHFSILPMTFLKIFYLHHACMSWGLTLWKNFAKKCTASVFSRGGRIPPPLPSGLSCILIFHYKNLIFGKTNFTMKN